MAKILLMSLNLIRASNVNKGKRSGKKFSLAQTALPVYLFRSSRILEFLLRRQSEAHM